MKYSVVSIEDGTVVLEDEYGKLYKHFENELPSSVTEGSILVLNENEFLIDYEATAEKRRKIYEKFKLINNSKK